MSDSTRAGGEQEGTVPGDITNETEAATRTHSEDKGHVKGGETEDAGKAGGPVTRRLQGRVHPGWKPAEKKCPEGDGQDQAQVSVEQTTVRLPTFKKNPRPQAQQRQAA